MPQAVGHAAPRRRPRPGPTRMPVVAGVADEVPDDEEVGREAHAGDDAELVVEALDHGVGQRRRRSGAPAPS